MRFQSHSLQWQQLQSLLIAGVDNNVKECSLFIYLFNFLLSFDLFFHYVIKILDSFTRSRVSSWDLFKLPLFVYQGKEMCMLTWGPGGNFRMSIPSFYPVYLVDGIQAVSLGSRHLYLLSHLASLETLYYKLLIGVKLDAVISWRLYIACTYRYSTQHLSTVWNIKNNPHGYLAILNWITFDSWCPHYLEP